MAKALAIDPTHHAVQLAQRNDLVCVVCKKCSCHSRDRLEQECRTLEWYERNHITPPSESPGATLFTGM